MTAWSTGLLDDDAVPRGRAVPPAVRVHQEVRRSPDGDAVGALVVTEREVVHLRAPGLRVHLAVTGGAGALEAALRWHAEHGAEAIDLTRVSVRLRGEAELAHNARRVVTVLDSTRLPDGVEVHAAPPEPLGGPSPAWLAALDELAAREVGLRLPLDATWTPAAVDAALDREQPMVFDTDDEQGPQRAMAAVRSALDGEPPGPTWLADDPELGARTRRWCRGVVVADLAGAAAALRR